MAGWRGRGVRKAGYLEDNTRVVKSAEDLKACPSQPLTQDVCHGLVLDDSAPDELDEAASYLSFLSMSNTCARNSSKSLLNIFPRTLMEPSQL